MATIFYGWKRKVGIVTLLMACALMMGWIRSQSRTDSTLFPIDNSFALQLISHGGKLAIRKCRNRFPIKPVSGDVDHVQLSGGFLKIGTGFTVPIEEPPRDESGRPLNWWITDSWGIEYGCLDQRSISIENRWVTLVAVWRIPYSHIILPLTLISAWLLLSKPRKPAIQ